MTESMRLFTTRQHNTRRRLWMLYRNIHKTSVLEEEKKDLPSLVSQIQVMKDSIRSSWTSKWTQRKHSTLCKELLSNKAQQELLLSHRTIITALRALLWQTMQFAIIWRGLKTIAHILLVKSTCLMLKIAVHLWEILLKVGSITDTKKRTFFKTQVKGTKDWCLSEQA